MSKGEIVEHLGEGQYRVRQLLAVDRLEREINALDARIAELAIEVPNRKSELLIAQRRVDSKAREIDLAIMDYRAGKDNAREVVVDLQTELAELNADARAVELQTAAVIAENLATLKRRGQLASTPVERHLEAWCADYSLELSGEVGLVDINDEGGRGVLIQPGHDGQAAYDLKRDGALFPNAGQTSHQLYFNAAILPGVQRWRPRYRLGTISRLVGDACDVKLDTASSSAQSLDINGDETLQSVPIKYMDCNAFVFEEGDRVLVRFTKSGPLVVGFAENPKECDVAFLCHMEYNYCSVDYNGIPFRATFYKINFSTYEIEHHSGVDIAKNVLVPGTGYYVHNHAPFHGLWVNPYCQFDSYKTWTYDVLSGAGRLSLDVISPAKISDRDGVGIISGEPRPTLAFFDVETFARTGRYSHWDTSADLAFESLVANSDSVVVQTLRDPPYYYGLLSFDRAMNLQARHDYGASYYGGIYGIAANSRYVFVVVWGDQNRLVVHDAKTLDIVYSVAIPFGAQQVAATNMHLILCRRKNEPPASEDGSTQIYRISDKDGFNLTLKKSAYWHVADGNTLYPIA